MLSPEEMTQLADQIEASNGLVRMVPGQGPTQLGIKNTAAIVALLRNRGTHPEEEAILFATGHMPEDLV